MVGGDVAFWRDLARFGVFVTGFGRAPGVRRRPDRAGCDRERRRTRFPVRDRKAPKARGVSPGWRGKRVGGEAAGGSEHSTFNIERPTSNEGGTGGRARQERVVLVFMDTTSHNSVAHAREILYIYFNIHL